ncbi:hypothetical protein CMQ_4242 [Grosmannia clavigera kw1407]|uniref:Uncharacterized protein n=1 Tax=Grosmannia clavigera (strain kw1407 / UAMH 11150) TaxID=655863 RepID=F0XAN2_GROCL|nr:uncharacterized protein CMQ_4242 [Grosmannia clavigera kw1407]EFX06173.1 hypothetical protein CMQ_4242 [Grosmannia clavigera kw1407]
MTGKDHLNYNRTANTIVRQNRSVLYNDPGDQALYKIVDVHFLGFEWVQFTKLENKSNQAFTRTETYSTQFRDAKTKDETSTMDVSGAFEGLTLSLGNSTSTITTQEVTTTKTCTTTVKVDPKSTIYLYQKRYHFKAVVWYKIDAWGKLWTVGNWKGAGVAHKAQEIQIDTSEFIGTPSALPGSGMLHVAKGKDIWAQDNIKQFDQCPKKCQDYLHDRGV